MKKIIITILIGVIVISLVFLLYVVLWYIGIIPSISYSSEYFGIEDIKSSVDYNNNQIDDYTDILNGARKDAKNKPRYVSDSYTKGGYPPDDIGVCSDVIWRAFKEAGYNLKDLVDNDIKENNLLYPAAKKPDPNIDFRRVRNLKVFFDRHSQALTNDIYDISNWNMGDIVIFGENYTHIGIISDKRNKNGVPFLIHNSGQPKREEDIIEIIIKYNHITGHYRWNK